VKNRSLTAYCAPFIVFMLFLGLVDLVTGLKRPEFFLSNPKYWVFPLQTLVCGGLLIAYWRHYKLQLPKKVALTLAIAILVLGLWILPQELMRILPHELLGILPQKLLEFLRRDDGFNPTIFSSAPLLYWTTVGLRFLRLVVVVPLLEEIFWRGFLLRYLIREDFEAVPFGSFSWTSFGGVTLMFGLAHWGPDFVPALACGALFNWIAIHTRSLSACVLAHAVTNLLLGFYIMTTRQWGFW